MDIPPFSTPGFRELVTKETKTFPPLTEERLKDHLQDFFKDPKAVGFKATFTFHYTSRKDLKKQLAASGLLTKSISKRSRIRMKLALKYGGFFK